MAGNKGVWKTPRTAVSEGKAHAPNGNTRTNRLDRREARTAKRQRYQQPGRRRIQDAERI
jgi:hypothetical protein